ncbi:hypothetical protein HDU86_002099 [Geranomyces michiganensis]|nr:hypothetical protein HDU86_002099 [Geranomyces michiganensis]
MRIVRPARPVSIFPQKNARLSLFTIVGTAVVSVFTGFYVMEPYVKEYFGVVGPTVMTTAAPGGGGGAMESASVAEK